MKKFFFLATLVATIFTSCSKSEYEFHQTYFTPQEPNGKILYADQESDSTRIISYDPWTASAVFNSGVTSWFTITPTECNFKAGEQFASMRIDIQGSINNTGKIRSGHIVVKSFDTVGMLVKQTTWLNIIRPFGEAVNYDQTGNLLPEEERYMKFTGEVPSTNNQFEIEFKVYADNATLSSNVDWLIPVASTFSAGKHIVVIVANENEQTEPRVGVLTLTSNGISTPITITQAKANNK
jgi:hypothetical protein